MKLPRFSSPVVSHIAVALLGVCYLGTGVLSILDSKLVLALGLSRHGPWLIALEGLLSWVESGVWIVYVRGASSLLFRAGKVASWLVTRIRASQDPSG